MLFIYFGQILIACRILYNCLSGGALTTHGYHGDSVGNFKSPLAVILDDAGNILIGDNTTSK